MDGREMEAWLASDTIQFDTLLWLVVVGAWHGKCIK